MLDVAAVHAHQDLSRGGEHGEVDKEAGHTRGHHMTGSSQTSALQRERYNRLIILKNQFV